MGGGPSVATGQQQHVGEGAHLGCPAHQELLALLLFSGTKHLIVLQILLQDLQPRLQELLREGEKGDIVRRGFWKPLLIEEEARLKPYLGRMDRA